MTRGRKRKHNPTIPAHIDQKKLPVGVYWDDRDRVWYTLSRDGANKARRKNLAKADAMLSDLHRAMEEARGVNRKSFQWLFEQYHASHVFKEKAESTRDSYETQRQVALSFPTKLGVSLGELDYGRLETHHFQKIVDAIADAGTPTKANSLMRYLKLVYSWAVRRGYANKNPVKGVQEATERKRRRLPDPATMTALVRLAADGGQLKPHTKGSCPPYLWAVADIAYLCRLRGIEVVTLMEDAAEAAGLRTNRRKGSRDNIVAWTPRLRAAYDWLIARRDAVWAAKHQPVPMLAKNRPIVISEDGDALDKSSLDTAWQRLIKRAISEKVITEDQRFGLHDLKRRGITDTAGTRADKQHASGHKSESMMDTYDLSVPVVQPSTMA
jgi:site-specific recombinase XerC